MRTLSINDMDSGFPATAPITTLVASTAAQSMRARTVRRAVTEAVSLSISLVEQLQAFEREVFFDLLDSCRVRRDAFGQTPCRDDSARIP